MIHTKYLILGAGVSGLAFVNNIDSNDYIIIERESRAGGYCRTTRNGEYVWDYAGHFFHFSHPELKAKFEQITSSDDTVVRVKDTRIYYDGRYVDYPFQKNIHQLTKEEMIDCLYGLFTKTEKEKYDNFLDMLYGKFGEGITEKFLKPYNEKLYACDLNRLDVDSMGRFFPYADVKDIILNMKTSNNASYNQSFLYPKRGAEVFVEKLLEQISLDRLHCNETAISINTQEKRVDTDKNSYSYDYLISSIPLDNFISMSDLKDIYDPAIFSYNKVLVINLGFDKPYEDKNVHWLYVPSKDINFYRVGFYNNIIGTEKLSLYIEIGYPNNYSISKEEVDEQLKKCIEGLKKMGIVTDHKLISYETIIMDPAYVHITSKSIETVNEIKDNLKSKGVFLVGRYGNWKYCSIEDCMLDSLEVKNSLE